MSFTESNYENAIIELFRNTLGYTHVCGYDVKRDYSDPFYAEGLLPALQRVNPQLPETVLNEAVQKIRNIENGTLQQKNVRFMDYLQNGVTIDYYDGKEQRSDLVYLVDYQNVNNHSFVIANQWTFTEKSEKRPDMIRPFL